MSISNIPELVALEPQAREVIKKYYGGDTPIEILIRMPIALNCVCREIFLYQRGDISEEQMGQYIRDDLDRVYTFETKCNRTTAFREKIKVIEGGKGNSSASFETTKIDGRLKLVSKGHSVDTRNSMSWSNLVFDPVSVLEGKN